MELRDGYKKTEVGIIPSDWKVVQFNEAVKNVQLGGNYKNGDSQNNSPLIKMGNLGRGFITLSKIEYVIDEQPSEKDRLNFGDVLFNTRNTLDLVGKVAIWRNELPKAYFNSNILRLSFDPEKIASNFYFNYYINTRRSISELRGLATGTTSVAAIYTRDLKKIKIVCPPPAEQQAIATALSDVDTLITNLDKLIAKKKAIKQGAMQRLLKSPAQGGQRLPGFEGEWRETNMGSVIDLLTGYPFSSSNYQEFGIRLLRGSNIKRGNTDWDESITQYWPEITLELKKFELKEGDIVIAMDGSLVGRSFAQLSSSDLPALLLQRVARIRSNSVDLNFLKELVCSDLFTKYCDSVKTVTAIPHISPDDIRNYPISLPPSKEEQQTIASILSDMDKEIESLERKKSKYLHIKQGKMQELLTGKTRLV